MRLLGDELVLPGGSAGMEEGTWIRAEGVVADGRLRVSELRELFDRGAREIEVEGVVQGVGAGAGADVWIEMCGRRIVVDPDADWENFGRAVTEVKSASAVASPAEALVEELYELDSDPSEQKNLAGQRPEEVARMRAEAAAAERSMKPVSEGRAGAVLDQATQERLRALGYLD